jgi:hypothetical protein
VDREKRCFSLSLGEERRHRHLIFFALLKTRVFHSGQDQWISVIVSPYILIVVYTLRVLKLQ